MNRGLQIAVWVIGGLATALILAMFVGAIVFPDPTAGRADSVWLLSWIGFPIVGTIIASQRPNARIGWILVGIGLSIGLGLGGTAYAELTVIREVVDFPAPLHVLWAADLLFIPAFVLIPFLILHFPSDRLPSRRWRIPAGLAVAVALVDTLAWAVRPAYQLTGEGVFVDNPFGVDALAWLAEPAIAISGNLLAAFGFVVVVNLVFRYVRSDGETRLQMKWFVYAAAMFIVTFLVGGALEEFVSLAVSNALILGGFVLGFNGLAAAIGIAILKYRLYDIDLVINKTLVYAALAAFITLIYVGVAVGIGTLVGQGDEPNLALSLLATVLVAVAFQPARHRVQRVANRLVFGDRLSPYEAVTSFSHRVSATLDPDTLLKEMAEAAAKGVGAERARVKLLLPDGTSEEHTFGDDTREDSFDRTLAVTHLGEVVGEISVEKKKGEQLTRQDDSLLQDLAGQAGLALRNLRLTEELRHHLVELQESRKRIVEAQDQERRRMERDIHDGAQQQLVAMSVKLGLAQATLAKDASKSEGLLVELKQETQEAVDTLRDLARGLFPPILVDQGLIAALNSHLTKSNLPASIEDATAGARFALEVESNVFFVIREALQNASKHAPGADIHIRLEAKVDHLSFEVRDEGPGFDPATATTSSGTQNMADRIEALGGTFEIISSSGQGTTVRGMVPAKAMEAVA